MNSERILYPLTDPQYQIWLSHESCPDRALFTESALVSFPAETAPSFLCEKLNRLVEETEVLRIRLCLGEDGPAQYDGGYRPFFCHPFPLESEEELAAQFDAASREPFSLYGGPLFRCRIYSAPERQAVLLQAHHLITDGYGFAAVCDRFVKLCAGETPPPFSSFLGLCGKQQPAGERELAESRAFWMEYLDGADFGAAPHPLPPELDYRIQWASFPLKEGLAQSLRSFLQRERVSAFCAFFAACAVYLSRVLSSQDVTILVPRLNRDTEESRRASGMFTAVVPVRVQVQPGLSFGELCRRVQAESRAAACHKNYSLSRILSDLQQEKAAGSQISYFTLSFLGGAPQPAGKVLALETHLGGAMVNLATFVVIDSTGRGDYRFQIDYRSGYYTAREAARMAGSILLVLEQGVTGGAADCSRLELMGSREKLRLQQLLSGAEMPETRSQTVPGLFRRQAALRPDAHALSGRGRSYTFRELDEASDRAAQALVAAGVTPESLVAFLLPRTTDLPVILLGILKAGAAFVPIDFSYPEERIRYILENSGAALLITPRLELAEAVGCRALYPAEVLKGPEGPAPALPEVRPEWLCYIIYTSGTTGRPKGVMIEHHSVANFVHPDGNPFNRDAAANGTGIVAVGSICFDISMFEIFSTLLNGVPVVFADENGMNDPVALAQYLRESGANILHCTPSRLLAYLEEPEFKDAMAGVDIILAAGEAFTQPLLDALTAATSARLYNGYGPTEGTIGVTVGQVTGQITIGSVVNGARVYLLDGERRLVPQGAAGEIAIAGEGLARGYLHLDGLTAERFVPLRDGPIQDKVYLTGDYGCALPDGRLSYLGRRDEQVKLRGLRIELQEIEHCVESYPGVRQCAVLVRELEGRQHLCCYYSASEEPVDAAALKQYAGGFLARYMVPEFFIRLSSLPSTSNGKIDKKALAAMELHLDHSYVAPRDERERTLCRIFAQVLGLEENKVSAADSFFQLGGTSLLAARVVLLAKRERLPLSYSDVFESPTPQALAERLGGVPHSKAPEEDAQAAPQPCSRQELPRLRAALKGNTCYQPGRRPLGNILLTGATGFLGIHLLRELLKDENNTVYCIVRPKNGLSPEKRLAASLFYYFEDSFQSMFHRRLFAVNGDLLRKGLAELPEGVKIDTVVNCAADVSHFDADGRIRETNVKGVQNVIDFCKRRNAALLHISTLSVGGFISRELADMGVCLNERRLWIRQDLSNVYLESKFTAEKLVLLAVHDGLRAKIMRVGNLQGRISDGEFQMNKATNGFVKLLQSIVTTGKCPESFARSLINFSPVDSSAEAICRVAGSRPEYTVFHIFNDKSLPASRLLEQLRRMNRPVEVLKEKDFDQFLLEAAEDPARHGLLEGFLTGVSGGKDMVEAPCESSFSIQALQSEGFSWPEISDGYLYSYLSGQETLGAFDL